MLPCSLLSRCVPLKQNALVVNGAIIASSMQLTDFDVCYSVMPLFHIGGISASVLCTLVSGGQLCCDNQIFDPSRMIDALATSNPQPTWYSAVPTIHNATVAFMKDRANKDSKLAEYGIKDGTWEKGHSLRQIRSGAAALLEPDGEALRKAYGGVPIYQTYSMSEQVRWNAVIWLVTQWSHHLCYYPCSFYPFRCPSHNLQSDKGACSSLKQDPSVVLWLHPSRSLAVRIIAHNLMELKERSQ